MIHRRAVVIKLNGDEECADALALAAISPEIRTLRAENAEYRRQLDAIRERRWHENAAKLAAYEARARSFKPNLNVLTLIFYIASEIGDRIKRCTICRRR